MSVLCDIKLFTQPFIKYDVGHISDKNVFLLDIVNNKPCREWQFNTNQPYLFTQNSDGSFVRMSLFRQGIFPHPVQ